MALQKTFIDIELSELMSAATSEYDGGSRFVQMLCVNTEAGIDMVYSFMTPADDEGGRELHNYQITAVDAEHDVVPSVTGMYLSAFPFENEAHELFGVNVENIAIDFKEAFYGTTIDEPMTVISPAQKAAREKAAKAAAAKAAREAKAKAAQEAPAGEGATAPAADKPAAAAADADAALEAKLANMDPEKAAKVRAAMAAKAAKAAREAAAKGGE